MVKITGKQNGPLLVEVEGQFVRIKNGKEETLEQNIIALCRCGASANKPFCDGSLDLVVVRGIRVVTTVKNLDFFRLGWCRFDRDMLRCFPGQSAGAPAMISAQEGVLRRVFTASERALMFRALGDDTRVLARAESF